MGDETNGSGVGAPSLVCTQRECRHMDARCWVAVPATPDADDASERGCRECGPGCLGHAASTPKPWPANSWPTAAELADWLSRCTHDERLSYADHSIATAQRAARCVDHDHEGRIARESAAATRARAEERERIAQAIEAGCGAPRGICPVCRKAARIARETP